MGRRYIHPSTRSAVEFFCTQGPRRADTGEGLAIDTAAAAEDLADGRAEVAEEVAGRYAHC
eukprot:6274718-Alexandrium_andersonii.AAC.1